MLMAIFLLPCPTRHSDSDSCVGVQLSFSSSPPRGFRSSVALGADRGHTHVARAPPPSDEPPSTRHYSGAQCSRRPGWLDSGGDTFLRASGGTGWRGGRARLRSSKDWILEECAIGGGASGVDPGRVLAGACEEGVAPFLLLAAAGIGAVRSVDVSPVDWPAAAQRGDGELHGQGGAGGPQHLLWVHLHEPLFARFLSNCLFLAWLLCARLFSSLRQIRRNG